MKKTLCSILFLITISKFSTLKAQILSVSPGTDVVVMQGTVFSTDGLALTPSVDFTLSNVSISRNSTVSHPTVNTYIARVYKFSTGTNLFNGTIRINYQDGAELNGLTKTDLQLNVHNGNAWQAFAAATNDPVNNYVLTTSLSGLQLDEITLASVSGPLPLQWRSFTAAKQQNNVLLQWSTFAERNSKSFIIQTSTNGITWNTIATISAAGNSSSVKNYNYLHTTPVEGYNYYRIIETDMDGRQNYSVVQKVFFASPSSYVQLLGNPVTNGMLIAKVNVARQNDKLPMLKLYTNDGKLLLQQQAVDGVNNIKVTGFAKGTYLLQANSTTIKFLIQ